MGWKTSKPHEGKDTRIGEHVDVYHTDSAGERDQPHDTDLKISHDSSKPLVQDIKPPK